MFKKILYHAGYAALGLSLLIVMAVFQAKGLQTSGQPAGPSDTYKEETLPAPEATVASLPAGQLGVPATMTSSLKDEELSSSPSSGSATFSPREKELPRRSLSLGRGSRGEGLKGGEAPQSIPLDTVQAYRIYDARHKAVTIQGFTGTPNGIRSALAYYRKVAGRSSSRTVIEAETPEGVWVSVLPSVFKKHAQKIMGQ